MRKLRFRFPTTLTLQRYQPHLFCRLLFLSYLFLSPLFSSFLYANESQQNTTTLVSAAPLTEAHSAPSGLLAIVIDDLGYRRYPAGLDNLPIQINLAILPDTPHAQSVAEEGARQGRDVIIHMPMEPVGNAPLEPSTLLDTMDKTAFQETLLNALTRLPQAIGMNNHMGSSLTAKPEKMHWVMEVLSMHGLAFLDSVTTVDTVARDIAREHSIPTVRRHIFLDHLQDADFIQKQLVLAAETARQHRYAIAIAHPHALTFSVLESELPHLDVTLVKLSELWQYEANLANHQ